MNTAALRGHSKGILRPELYMGHVDTVSASHAHMTLSAAGAPSGSHFEAGRYGRGEVGEFVLIEGQLNLVLGRLIAVELQEKERRKIAADSSARSTDIDVVGTVQFLGTVRSDTLRVSAGVASYPRLGDRVYAAPHSFVGQIPHLMNADAGNTEISLTLGTVNNASGAVVQARPEKLFGRHCAVLGATGGGKSWTVARLIEECSLQAAKVILLDATGEYRSLPDGVTEHCHLGDPPGRAASSTECGLPASNFQESDLIALFEPAGKVQGPKLREAIRSLRLVYLDNQLGRNGLLVKANRQKAGIEAAMRKHTQALEDPRSPFDISKIPEQVFEECVWPDSKHNIGCWGGHSDSEQSYCLSLVTRASGIITSAAFAPVFRPPTNNNTVTGAIDWFIGQADKRVLRICLAGVSYEYRAREFIVNAIGRYLLTIARCGRFQDQPLIVFVDEAHNFLGRAVGSEDSAVRLDAFEIIAREGRKYGLNVCLATQRPRDLTEDVLSQIGTLIVHRLTNDRDREIVERACGEIDRSASAFLANLRSGEAVVIGADFPIPLTVQMKPPTAAPLSDGPNYQKAWAAANAGNSPSAATVSASNDAALM